MFEKVSAAEQRQKVGADWPNCSCHGEPMRWNADPTRSGGGRFRCAVQGREQKKASWVGRYREHVNARRRERYARDPDIREREQASRDKRVYVGKNYVGMEHHFPGGRKAVAPLIETHLRFKQQQAAERRSLTKEPASESE